jgi:hypothetical protein
MAVEKFLDPGFAGQYGRMVWLSASDTSLQSTEGLLYGRKNNIDKNIQNLSDLLLDLS